MAQVRSLYMDLPEFISCDICFLLSLSDNTLPVIEKNIDVLENDTTFSKQHRSNAIEFFQTRKKMFFEEQKKYTWLSWNLADANTKKELSGKPISSLK